jgi:hypothetical protein
MGDALGTVLGSALGTDASSGTGQHQMYGAAICDRGRAGVHFRCRPRLCLGDTGEKLGELEREPT